MDNLLEEVEKIVKFRDLYIKVKNFSSEFVKEKPIIKKDLEWLSRVSEKAIETCDNALNSKILYSEEWSKQVIFEFKSRNQIIYEEVYKITQRISPYLSEGDDPGLYKKFNLN